MPPYRIVLAILLICTVSSTLRADDSAASVAAGGIHLTRQRGIAMEKEVLRIGLDKVEVRYWFLNTMSSAITTEVAFPLPVVPVGQVQASAVVPGGIFHANSFKLWVNGRPKQYQVVVKALWQGKNYFHELQQYKIDAATYGGLADSPTMGESAPEIARLPAASRQRLLKQGLIDQDGVPTWTDQVYYYWEQIFPAGGIVRIRHEYRPAYGAEWGLGHSFFKDLTSNKKLAHQEARFGSACVDPALAKVMDQRSRGGPEDGGTVRWIDFILTTANNWKTPIRDFELVIKKPPLTWDSRIDSDNPGDQEYISLCFPAQFRKTDGDTLVADIKNFVPHQNLHVVYFRVSAIRNP